MNILVTGAAGFIGSALTLRLMEDGHNVVGIDNFNDYYDVSLKRARVARALALDNFTLYEIDVADKDAVTKVFKNESIDRVMHLAAQAGVRYSLDNPSAYIDANMHGFLNILEACRDYPVEPDLRYSSTRGVEE